MLRGRRAEARRDAVCPLERALLRHALAHRLRERRGGRHGALGRGVSHSVRREVALARVVFQGQHGRGGGPGDDRPDPRARRRRGALRRGGLRGRDWLD